MFLFRAVSMRQTNLAHFVIRIVAGSSMAAHGYQKVFQYGFSAVADSFSKMGVLLPGVAGPFVGVLELVGGVAVAIGLLTRPFAALLAFEMLAAAFLVHLPSGFFAPKGVELPLLFAAMFEALAIAGGGTMSVDGVLDRNSSSESR